jgi:competence protein ComGC
MKLTRGFTLIELLIFVALFSIVIVALILIFVQVITVQTGAVASSEVTAQGQFLLQQIQSYVQNSRIINMSANVTTSTLTLSTFNSALDPTLITLSSGTVYLQQGATGTLQALTSNKVYISQISFSRPNGNLSHSSPHGGDSVLFSFTVNATSSKQTVYTQKFQSSATVLTPRPSIALVQEAIAENNTPSVGSLAATYPFNNVSSTLLIAVEASQSVTLPTISDSQGNTWKLVASNTYAGISNMTIALFVVTSAKAGSNTVTLSYGSPGNYPSLYLYEYRGATGIIAASSTQDNSSAQVPSTGLTLPVAGAELAVGVDAGVSLSAPAAGYGYTLEGTSTLNNVTQVYMEDMVHYASGAVSSSWTFGGAVSTTALLATFQ